MTEIRMETAIQCPAKKIFDVITDFRGQDRWLTEAWRHGADQITRAAVPLAIGAGGV